VTSKPDQREVPCPKCGKPLYVLVKVTKGDPLWRVTDGSPRVEEDDRGNFIRCPNCAERVAMEPNPEHVNAGYYVAEPPTPSR
jgi:DNA-directed RNA polymerase subunit RPC12/RpoP